MSLVSQVLSHTPKYWTNKNSDPVMAQKETLVTEVITNHPEWDMNTKVPNFMAIHLVVVKRFH